MLPAFAAGPLLVALFFLGAGLSRFRATDLVAACIAVALALILVLAGYRLRGLAERLLLSFFLWMAILLAPAFWQDPVSDQMAQALFGLLGLAGFPG